MNSLQGIMESVECNLSKKFGAFKFKDGLIAESFYSDDKDEVINAAKKMAEGITRADQHAEARTINGDGNFFDAEATILWTSVDEGKVPSDSDPEGTKIKKLTEGEDGSKIKFSEFINNLENLIKGITTKKHTISVYNILADAVGHSELGKLSSKKINWPQDSKDDSKIDFNKVIDSALGMIKSINNNKVLLDIHNMLVDYEKRDPDSFSPDIDNLQMDNILWEKKKEKIDKPKELKNKDGHKDSKTLKTLEAKKDKAKKEKEEKEKKAKEDKTKKEKEDKLAKEKKAKEEKKTKAKKKVASEGFDQRGVRDGTGPNKDSAQRSISDKGRRKLRGEECPADLEENNITSKGDIISMIVSLDNEDILEIAKKYVDSALTMDEVNWEEE